MTIHIVLYQPEIPQNTGNIMRTCAATGARLHLIKPLGFSLDEKHLKRAAMDYYQYVDYTVYEDYATFSATNPSKQIYFITRYAQQTHAAVDYSGQDDIYFVFGCESKGLPKALLQENLTHCLRIPMNGDVRSLNLSNCAAILVYEAYRQRDFAGLLSEEPENFKGRDWLLE